MKHIKSNILFFVVVAIISSCSAERIVSKNSAYNEAYNEHLSSIINDTIFYEFTQYSIIDKSIYPILDSVIFLSEKCKYFDKKVKYLNSFRFGIMYKNNKPSYSIDAHLSPAQAIGLILLETGAIEQIKDLGILYYKNYLFVIPPFNLGGQYKLEYFPFVKESKNKLKIKAPKFFEEKVYSSYITFSKDNDSYKINENEVCGLQILIQ